MLRTIKDVAKGIYGIPKIVHAKVSLVDIKSIIITMRLGGFKIIRIR